MNKILVTTDFSKNSKAGMRFAIQLATQHKFRLTFFHSFHIEKTPPRGEPVFESYQKSEFTSIKTRLCHFVEAVYKSIGIVPENMECVVKSSSLTDINIMNYAVQNEFSFICISRSGEGKQTRGFGPNTFNLVTKSEVPVIAVPDSYRRSKITSILYASDLFNLENEVKKVVDFARPLKSKIELLHFNVPSDHASDLKLLEKTINQFSSYRINFHMENLDITETFITNLQRAIKKSKPSMMIMFRHQNRNFFERLFMPGRASRYLFQAEIPLLVFKNV
ncbi:MAG TPA: universal stress protein [Sphingobacteriaceae bacterium]